MIIPIDTKEWWFQDLPFKLVPNILGSSLPASGSGTLPLTEPTPNAASTLPVVVPSTPQPDVASASAPLVANAVEPLAEDDVEMDIHLSDEKTLPIRRGNNMGVPGWNTGAKYEVEYIEVFVPVGENAKRLRSQLGILVRDGQRLPLTTLSWTCFGEDVMDSIWEEVKTNLLNPPGEYKEVCLHMCNLMWKDHKSKTKKNYFTKVKNKPNLEKYPPPGVLPPDWVWLIAYWRSRDAQKQSEQNSKNRDKHGRRISPGVTHLLKRKQPTDKMSLWISSRKADDPDVIETIKDFNELLELEPEDQRELDAMKDKIFHQLMGPDGHGYCRTYDASAPPRLVHQSSSSTPLVAVRELREIAQQLELNLKTHLETHLKNHKDTQVEKRIQDLRSELMVSCRCNDVRGSHLHQQASVHQKNPRESTGEGCTIVSTNQAALNTSTEPEGDTEQSARGENDKDAV